MPKGLSIRSNSRGIPILRLHYSAMAGRDQDWVDSERPKYSEAMWQQEQEIDYSAAGGERVLRSLLERRWNDIVITDPAWEPDPKWSYGAGFDFGKSHPTALVLFCIDFDGNKYALAEHYRSGLTPREHMKIIRNFRIPLGREEAPKSFLSLARSTHHDPSMGFKNLAGEESFTSYVQLFINAGWPVSNLREGQRVVGGDKAIADEILEAWSQEDPTFKIVLRCDGPRDPGSMQKREGTFPDGCPNLLWEMLNIRRVERTASSTEKLGPSEALMDKDNDAFDATCYWWRDNKSAARQSRDMLWKSRVGAIRKKNPEIDLNSLSVMHAKFEREMNKQEIHSWR